MQRLILILLLLLASLSRADEEIDITNLTLKSSNNENAPITIYGNITNPSEQLEYLLGIEIINYPEAKISINKTVIEQNVARIIKIDRLAIPSHSTVDLTAFGIYLVANNLFFKPSIHNKIKLKFIFSKYEMVKEIYTTIND